MSEIKILHLISNPCLGGAQSLIRDIVMNSDNHSIYTFRKSEENMFKDMNCVFNYNSTKNYKFNLKIPLNICKIIDQEKIQILHLHLHKSIIYAFIIKLLRPRIKLIFHEHGPILVSNSNKDYFEYIMPLKIFNTIINKFILISKSVANLYVKKLKIGENRVKIIYNPIDTGKFTSKKNNLEINSFKKKLGINKKDYIIGFVGRLSELKGCSYLIEALRLLKFNFKLIIVGDGELRSKLERQVDILNLTSKVVFLGYVEEPHKVYPILNVLVMPSLHEGAGLALLEAQASGIPVIGSDVSAINEFIIPNKTGLLFTAKDSIDLAKKLTIIHDDKQLREKMSKNALKNITQYSLKKYLRDLDMLYHEVLIGK